MKTIRSLHQLQALVVFATLYSTTIAHMEMRSPVPFRSKFNDRARAAQIDYDMMAPLEPDGSNFPCKGYQSDTTQERSASYVAGQTYNVALAGTVMHGGGSCQIALSYDQGQTFRVVKSIIGGCPYSMNYDFTIPDSAPEGDAILAWTWQNNIGNREFYMNCAPVQVSTSAPAVREKRQTNTSGDFDDLPSLWIANLQRINGCRTTENTSPVYPNPGDDVEYGNGYSESSPPTVGDCEFPDQGRSFAESEQVQPDTVDDEKEATNASDAAEPAVPAEPSPPSSEETPGMPVMAAAQGTLYAEPTPSPMASNFDDVYASLYNIRFAVATAGASTNDPDVVTIYTTISACPTETTTTVFSPSTSRTWTTTTRGPTPTPSPDPDVEPFPPSSPRYASSASEANRLLLPCVPNTLLCESPSSFLVCAPTPPDSEYAGSRNYVYGYPRQVAAGMACLPFLSPYGSGTPDGGDAGRQRTEEEGRFRDDRYVRDRPDGSCPARREGGIRCKEDGRGFFVCDQGAWVDMGATAQGTVCRDGEIVEG